MTSHRGGSFPWIKGGDMGGGGEKEQAKMTVTAQENASSHEGSSAGQSLQQTKPYGVWIEKNGAGKGEGDRGFAYFIFCLVRKRGKIERSYGSQPKKRILDVNPDHKKVRGEE